MIELWKVVDLNDDGTMESMIAGEDCTRRYAVGELTYPVPSSGLLCFASYSAAANWRILMGGRSAILRGRGEAGPPLPRFDTTLNFNEFSPEKVAKAWQIDHGEYNGWPYGTVSAAWFIPEEVVV